MAEGPSSRIAVLQRVRRAKTDHSPHHLFDEIERSRMEQLVDRQLPARQPLFGRVPEQRFKGRSVRCDAVGPVIVTHELAGIFELLTEPRQRDHGPAELREIIGVELFCL